MIYLYLNFLQNINNGWSYLGLFGSSTSYTTFPFISGSAVAHLIQTNGWKVLHLAPCWFRRRKTHSARSWFSLAARPSLLARSDVSLCWSWSVTWQTLLRMAFSKEDPHMHGSYISFANLVWTVTWNYKQHEDKKPPWINTINPDWSTLEYLHTKPNDRIQGKHLFR